MQKETCQMHVYTHCIIFTHTETRCTMLQHDSQTKSCEMHMYTHCNVFTHTATCCNMLQRAATRFAEKDVRDAYVQALQHIYTHCNMLQHTATCCNTLQHAATRFAERDVQGLASYIYTYSRRKVCCRVLQCVAVCCSVT